MIGSGVINKMPVPQTAGAAEVGAVPIIYRRGRHRETRVVNPPAQKTWPVLEAEIAQQMQAAEAATVQANVPTDTNGGQQS